MEEEHCTGCRDEWHQTAIEPGRTHVLEAPRRTRVAADVDVLVCGGGPAGVGAALAAAREGARTLLVERHGMLGGMWTAGLLNPFFDFAQKGWLVAELIDDLKAAGAWRTWRSAATFDTEVMKHLLERKLTQAGAAFWYHSLVTDAIVEADHVRGVLVESKSGREAVLARVVIDCTGDGDVAARAGACYDVGRLQDGLTQPLTLMFEIEGTAGFEQKSAPALYDQMAAAIEAHNLDATLPFERANYVPWIITVPRPGTAQVQLTHVYRVNALDTRQLTAATVDARRQVHEILPVLKRVPGLEGIRLTQTAPAIGVRETRRVRGRYVLSLEDLADGRRFGDAVTACFFGVDIHEPAPGAGIPSGHGAPTKPYEIPYRCLLPQDREGLLVAGRCISGTHEAHASYRVTGTCMAMGQAAGLAAALAARGGCLPSELDGCALRAMLEERGVRFLHRA
ncbi:MAG: FAD-dependent oxidoreductase [Armatimonadota bacterium]|nr:FAD-dependent oxidoreductase [Armatimonadota bacterium]